MAYVAASTIDGMSVQTLSQGGVPNATTVRLLVYGTYTAADFYLSAADGAIFEPGKVRVLNTTDGTGSEWILPGPVQGLDDSGNAINNHTNLTNSGYTQVAAGDKTMVAKGSAGVSWDAGKLQFDVSACAPITNDDEVIIEISRG